MQLFGSPFMMQSVGIAGTGAGSQAELDRRIWDSQRAITGEGEENPFEIFRQRGEYIDRTERGGGLEPWEFGYQEPTETRSFADRMRAGSRQWACGRNPNAPGCEDVDISGMPGAPRTGGPFGVEWGSFLLRVVYVMIGVIFLGIGAAALANQASDNPLSRTVRQAQRFVSP